MKKNRKYLDSQLDKLRAGGLHGQNIAICIYSIKRKWWFPIGCVVTERYTGWHYEIERKESFDTEDVLHPLLEVFQSKTDTINQSKEELTLDVSLELVIQIYDGYTPGLVIYPEFSKFAAEINAFLDIDMYVFSSNEPGE